MGYNIKLVRLNSLIAQFVYFYSNIYNQDIF